MGWFRSSPVVLTTAVVAAVTTPQDKPEIAHIETVEPDVDVEHTVKIRRARPSNKTKRATRVPTPEFLAAASGSRTPIDVQNLPYISPDDVARHNNINDGIYIVINKRVYDVTNFLDIHPAGPEMLEQFAGTQCSWQFWKFHSLKDLQAWSPALLVGRTDDVPNLYPEPPRWINTS